MMLSACGGSANKPVVLADQSAARIVPRLSAEDERECNDPGVPAGAEALDIIAETRLALGKCKRRHARVVRQYNRIPAVLSAAQEGAGKGGV